MRDLRLARCSGASGASHHLAFVAVLAAVTPGAAEIQLMPAGDFRAIDGRPGDGKTWHLDRASAEALIARHSARKNPIAIDYEHQTVHAPENGQPAPAAGWINELQWREGQGLFGKVEWTDRAKQMIAAGEYRYISPTFRYDAKTGVPMELLPAALVNYPAIDGMQQVALSAIAEKFNTQSPQENQMNELLKAILAALGLPEDVTKDKAVTAVTTLQADAKKKGELETKVTSLTTEVTALKAAGPDPAKFVPIDSVKALQTQVAELQAANQARDIDTMIAAALESGKLLPDMEKWARELGKKDLAQLKGYLDSAAPIAALAGTQTRGKKPAGSASAKDDPIAIAKAAQKLMDEEAKAGRTLSSAEAVERVSATAAA